ncbi:AglZ/HisF2 family acetamidino modification protein [Marinobacter sp. BGYM27]|uniref:AglZ/HisF2 family acetamidino modification protein n=1 Tax=Marinobacter sp. BGYM27 TaxID=2975597 RepID=UPI0021A8D112|nr:AglZ/HisF2 family acetamidino modification protein [Marinobacter sp. BGYM27]MDG5499212.1 AglZ/HisF2 family acetamidino modification protein [Marinobacter sp. BGYM27]
MYRARVIPCLLVRGNGLVKTRKFKNGVYIGDPINAIRIFSDKEVDEIVVLDIDATKEGREPNYELVEEIAGEAFMPMAYGGGVQSLEQIRRLIRLGVEKVVINTAAFESKEAIVEASRVFGSQAIVGSIDAKRTVLGGYRVMSCSGTKDTKCGLLEHAQQLVTAGVGEILVNSIDRDGMMDGYDLKLIRSITDHVNVPVVASGGAGSIEDLKAGVLSGGASAVAAGSMFVFHGKHRAVLINYPQNIDFERIF